MRGAWRLPFLICGHSRNAGAGVPINSPARPHKGTSAAPSPAPEDAPLNRGRGKIGQETGFPVHKDRLLATSSGARRLERRLKLTSVLRGPLASPPLLWERKRVLTFAPDPQECSSIWLEHSPVTGKAAGSSPVDRAKWYNGCMNDQELIKKVDEMSAKVDEMQKTVNRLNNYFKWTAIITIALIVLPIIGLMFAIPSYLNTLNTITSF